MNQPLMSGHYFGSKLTERRVHNLILSETSYDSYAHIPVHSHNNFYICYVAEGQYDETLLGRKVRCQKGDVIFHPRQIEHSDLFSKKGGKCFNVELTEDFRKGANYPELNNYQLFDRGTAFLETNIKKIYDEYKLYDNFSETIIEGLIYEMIGYFGRKIYNDSPSYWFLKAKDIITGCDSPNISLSYISDELNISSSHLAREFKRAAGLTIGEYIRNVRIKKSCEKLKEKNSNILSIALEYGFTDQSHFTKTFKKVMGITPKHYWQIHNQNNTKISMLY